MDRHLWTIARKVCTAKQLEAARLVWANRIPSREAADLLGISHGALQDRLRNARKRITLELEQRKAA